MGGFVFLIPLFNQNVPYRVSRPYIFCIEIILFQKPVHGTRNGSITYFNEFKRYEPLRAYPAENIRLSRMTFFNGATINWKSGTGDEFIKYPDFTLGFVFIIGHDYSRRDQVGERAIGINQRGPSTGWRNVFQQARLIIVLFRHVHVAGVILPRLPWVKYQA